MVRSLFGLAYMAHRDDAPKVPHGTHKKARMPNNVKAARQERAGLITVSSESQSCRSPKAGVLLQN
jgi:hypothetical protein